MSSPGMLMYVFIYGILMVLGGWWCKEIFERLSDDIAEVRQPDNPLARGVIIGFWILTVFILLFEIVVIYRIAAGIFFFLRAIF
jgi:hypothetical protein